MRLDGPALLLGTVLLTASVSAGDAARAPRGPVVEAQAAYARRAHSMYSQSVRALEELRNEVRAFVSRPTPETLARARAAWVASRDVYCRTETFRFSAGPIDRADPVTGAEGPEGRIDAWPIDEGYLDYVAGAPRSGLLSDLSFPVAESTLVQRNAVADPRQVTLGFHAIEFLLWGQDHSRESAGKRPHTDFLPGQKVRERRAAFLALLVDLLIRDVKQVADAWRPEPGSYAAAFVALAPSDALGLALSGPATLAAFELASERIGLPLSSREQEDELSCFSDNTLRDLVADIEGIAMVMEGDEALPGLLSALDGRNAADIRDRLARIRSLARSIPSPFDDILTAPDEDARRVRLQALMGELLSLAGAIQRAGEGPSARVELGSGR